MPNPICNHIEDGIACCSESRPALDRFGKRMTWRPLGASKRTPALPLWECTDGGHMFVVPDRETPEHDDRMNREAGE